MSSDIRSHHISLAYELHRTMGQRAAHLAKRVEGIDWGSRLDHDYEVTDRLIDLFHRALDEGDDELAADIWPRLLDMAEVTRVDDVMLEGL